MKELISAGLVAGAIAITAGGGISIGAQRWPGAELLAHIRCFLPIRISDPPTNARLQQGIREGPIQTSSERMDERSETDAHANTHFDREKEPAPVVIMRDEGGGIEILAEDRTYALGRDP